jgi:hypothetical protein
MLVHMVANATEKTMSAVAGPSPASWPDVLGIPAVAQPLLAIAAVASLAAALWLLGAWDPSPSGHNRVAFGAWS